MRVDNVPAELLDEAVREQLFGRYKPYAMPTAGYADDVKKLGVTELTPSIAASTRPTTRADRGRRHHAGGRAQARREILRADPSRKVEPRRARRTAEPTCRSAWCAPMPASPSRAGSRTSWRRPIAGRDQHSHALLVLARLFGGSETTVLSRRLRADQDRPVGERGLQCRGGSASPNVEISVQPARGRRAAEIRGGGRHREEARARFGDVTACGTRTGAEPAAGVRVSTPRIRCRAAPGSTATCSAPAARSPDIDGCRTKIAALRRTM
jgi:zinc protease